MELAILLRSARGQQIGAEPLSMLPKFMCDDDEDDLNDDEDDGTGLT
jgi:hypothetical protein